MNDSPVRDKKPSLVLPPGEALTAASLTVTDETLEATAML
jgi:hypothetical protein